MGGPGSGRKKGSTGGKMTSTSATKSWGRGAAKSAQKIRIESKGKGLAGRNTAIKAKNRVTMFKKGNTTMTPNWKAKTRYSKKG